MNIVFGGSFNPPTKAHIEILDLLNKEFKPENILVIPTGDSYTWKNITPFKYRYEMAKLAFKNYKVLPLEQEDKYRGTINTLRYLSKEYSSLYFCMGADNIVHIKEWIEYEALLNEFNFIVIKRSNIDILGFINENLAKYKDKFIVFEYNNDISATEFRIKKDKKLVNDDIYDYIINNHLY